MSASDSNQVAIIGGGIAGMALAICLSQLQIPCTVFEMRPSEVAPRTAGGALMMSPNALRILDFLGVYERMLPKGFQFDYVYYKDANEKTVDRYPLGSREIFGYQAVRIYRQELLNSLYDVCRERGVPILFSHKFTRVVEETPDNVTFELADGTQRTAKLLVGADGIWSKLRNYVSPGIKPGFLGLAAVTYAVSSAQIRVPEGKDYKFPVTLTTNNGAFVLAYQRPDGSEMLAGTQYPFEDHTAEGWQQVLHDKEALLKLVRTNTSAWPDVIQSALENIETDTMNVWPFYLLPHLPNWASSPHRRVVILGDAAHALPPTAGQGASQAFEDVQSLALLVAALRANPGRVLWEDALVFWQSMRQERVEALMELTRKLNNKRLPADQLAKLGPEDVWVEEGLDQMAWLYDPKIPEKVDAWVQSQLQKT